ncbi:MAG: hypothetical protein R3250_14430, partial [Melioribacteraceae bacterium]|nr:hypothetical protein [Melioribacteraceae bacterium]
GGLVPLLIFNYYTSNVIQQYFILGTNAIILFVFLRWFMINYFTSDLINQFFLTMVFLQAIIIIKLLALIKDLGIGVNVFFAGVSIQILIGIFLIVIRKKAQLDPPK